MIYENLRKIREEKGYTQTDVAEILNIKRQQYQRYESGNNEIPSRFIKQLAAVYKVSADYILGVDYDYFEDTPFDELISQSIGNYNKLNDLLDNANDDLKREISVMQYKLRNHASNLMIDSDCYVKLAEDHKKKPEKVLKTEEELFRL